MSDAGATKPKDDAQKELFLVYGGIDQVKISGLYTATKLPRGGALNERFTARHTLKNAWMQASFRLLPHLFRPIFRT